MEKTKKEKISALKDELKESQLILSQTNDPQERKVIEKGIEIIKKEIEEIEKEEEKQPKEAKKKQIKKEKKNKKDKEEKTVKISKVIPESEKKNVREILEKEYYKVIIKDVAGKKVKITVKHSDKTVAKNKIESAFVTVSKKINSEEEKKKYAEDLKVLASIEERFKKLIEVIYSVFNNHKTDELKKIFDKIDKIV